jgi:hypothetical protein
MVYSAGNGASKKGEKHVLFKDVKGDRDKKTRHDTLFLNGIRNLQVFKRDVQFISCRRNRPSQI